MSSFDSILGFADDFGKSLSGVLSFSEKLAPLLSMGKLGFDVVGSIQKYGAQKKYAAEMRNNIEEARANNQAALSERNEQQQAVNKEKMSERARQALAEKSKLAAIAAESGGGGGSDARLAMMPDFGLGHDIAALESSNAGLQRQFVREANRINNTADSQRKQIADPSMLALAGDLFGAGLGFADRSRVLNPTSQRNPRNYFQPLNIR